MRPDTAIDWIAHRARLRDHARRWLLKAEDQIQNPRGEEGGKREHAPSRSLTVKTCGDSDPIARKGDLSSRMSCAPHLLDPSVWSVASLGRVRHDADWPSSDSRNWWGGELGECPQYRALDSFSWPRSSRRDLAWGTARSVSNQESTESKTPCDRHKTRRFPLPPKCSAPANFASEARRPADSGVSNSAKMGPKRSQAPSCSEFNRDCVHQFRNARGTLVVGPCPSLDTRAAS